MQLFANAACHVTADNAVLLAIPHVLLRSLRQQPCCPLHSNSQPKRFSQRHFVVVHLYSISISIHYLLTELLCCVRSASHRATLPDFSARSKRTALPSFRWPSGGPSAHFRGCGGRSQPAVGPAAASCQHTAPGQGAGCCQDWPCTRGCRQASAVQFAAFWQGRCGKPRGMEGFACLTCVRSDLPIHIRQQQHPGEEE